MKTALISLSAEGPRIAQRLQPGLGGADIYIHEGVPADEQGTRFSGIVALTGEIFHRYGRLVFMAPCGVVVRAVVGVLADKHTDPAVVVVDGGGRFAISLLSGHEGGANDLSVTVANILGAEPVITTATEALKSVIVGIGCRRGAAEEKILQAVHTVLQREGIAIGEVRFLATADIKAGEAGLVTAARKLGVPLRLIPAAEIRSWEKAFAASAFVKEKVDLPAVAVPAAMLAGRRTTLILQKTIVSGVTVALARESFSWSVSDPGDR